jgi:hypothetical protein
MSKVGAAPRAALALNYHSRVAGGGRDTQLKGRPGIGELAREHIFRSQVPADQVSGTGYQVRVRVRA